jgi:hypothetical protein
VVRPPYHPTQRLFGIAEEHWQTIDGEAASNGVDYFQLPVDRFLNAIWWWAINRVRDQERFEHQLNAIPVGATVTEEDIKAEGESFMAFAAVMGVKPPGGDAPSAGANPVPSPSSV